MKKIFVLLLGLVFAFTCYAQNAPITKSNYELPARFTPDKMQRLVFSTNVSPHFLKNENEFWYEYKTSEGNTWYIVDALKGTKRVLFDNAKMAAQISELMQDPYDAQHLPIKNIRFNDDGHSFIFEVVSSQDMTKDEQADYEEYRQKEETDEDKVQKDSPMKKTVFFNYDIQTGKIAKLPDYKEPYDDPSWASPSPDGELVIFARDCNLFYMDKANFEKAKKNAKDSTIVEHQITTDGIEGFSWSGTSYSDTNVDKKKNEHNRKGVYVSWSEDSKHFLIGRTDDRKVGDLWVINNTAKPRPTLQTYKYHMPGEENAPQEYLYLFDSATKKCKMVDIAAYKDQTISVLTKDRKLVDRELLNSKPTEWLGDNSKFYLSRVSRDMKRIDLCVVDITSDSLKAKPLIEERMNTSMESRKIELIAGGKEIIAWSQRSGWGQLYL
ncbi:MAG: DPP IV N-terminal domain-containing protein, partial [Rikenellaceae bacterium]